MKTVECDACPMLEFCAPDYDCSIFFGASKKDGEEK